MKASELIEELQKLIQRHGNLDVFIIEKDDEILNRNEVLHSSITDCYHILSEEDDDYFLIS